MGVFYVALTLIHQLSAEAMQLEAYTCSRDPRLAKIRINDRFPVPECGKLITDIPYTVFEPGICKPGKFAIKIIGGNASQNS